MTGPITTTDSESNPETVNGKDLFFWLAGHTIMVIEDAEIIMFSLQHEHTMVINLY